MRTRLHSPVTLRRNELFRERARKRSGPLGRPRCTGREGRDGRSRFVLTLGPVGLPDRRYIGEERTGDPGGPPVDFGAGRLTEGQYAQPSSRRRSPSVRLWEIIGLPPRLLQQPERCPWEIPVTRPFTLYVRFVIPIVRTCSDLSTPIRGFAENWDSEAGGEPKIRRKRG